MQRFTLLAAILILLSPVTNPPLQASLETPVFDVVRPTILAFFKPSSHMNDTGSSANDALSDFQVYLNKAKYPLQRSGIDVQEVYARSFKVRVGTTVTTYQTKKSGIGYYLISPGKKARIEYGLTNDTDLIRIADEYFGVNAK